MAGLRITCEDWAIFLMPRRPMNPTCAVFRSCAFPTQSSTGVDSDRDVVEIARVVHGARV